MEPYSRASLMEFVLPGTMAVGVSLAAWLVLPTVLRRCHSYVESGPKARLLGREQGEKVPYHMSVFGALEDPARLLATAVTFSYLGYLVAPKSLGAQYLAQIRTGTTVLSIIWFLYLYKRNIFSRIVSGKSLSQADRERYLTMDRISSIGLLVLGCMALAESCGVAVQSVMTVGGIGGVATAFAARDLLGNMLSGIAIQFSRPFSVGDYITAGDLSGQVMEIGLHSTEMLNPDKFPTVVPNSFFSSQVIVNRSRVNWRGLDLNIPVRLTALEKLPTITSEVRNMLESHPRVFLENEKPRCYVSQVGPASFNLSVTCNLKPMSMDDFIVAKEEILLDASRTVVRSDPDSADGLLYGAEIMDKSVVHPPVSKREDRFSGNYGEGQSATVSREPGSRSSSMRDYTSSGNSRSSANSLPKPALTHLSSARRGDILGVTDSGRSNRESHVEAESPRKSQSSSILNVGSKLFSRIKHAKAKTVHS